jgi:hypothetical protein
MPTLYRSDRLSVQDPSSAEDVLDHSSMLQYYYAPVKMLLTPYSERSMTNLIHIPLHAKNYAYEYKNSGEVL